MACSPHRAALTQPSRAYQLFYQGEKSLYRDVAILCEKQGIILVQSSLYASCSLPNGHAIPLHQGEDAHPPFPMEWLVDWKSVSVSMKYDHPAVLLTQSSSLRLFLPTPGG